MIKAMEEVFNRLDLEVSILDKNNIVMGQSRDNYCCDLPQQELVVAKRAARGVVLHN
jgi:hypothetical protein